MFTPIQWCLWIHTSSTDRGGRWCVPQPVASAIANQSTPHQTLHSVLLFLAPLIDSLRKITLGLSRWHTDKVSLSLSLSLSLSPFKFSRRMVQLFSIPIAIIANHRHHVTWRYTQQYHRYSCARGELQRFRRKCQFLIIYFYNFKLHNFLNNLERKWYTWLDYV